jgi:hypothetical protein
MDQSARIEYSVVEGWEQLPKGYVHRDVAGVAVDGEDRVYLMCRGDHPVMVYDQKGKFLRSWGEGDFTYRTHGIYVGPDGTIFCTDDGNHTVRQFTPGCACSTRKAGSSRAGARPWPRRPEALQRRTASRWTPRATST